MIKAFYSILVINILFCQIQKAEFRLNQFELDQQKTVELSGEWQFYWNELITEKDSSKNHIM